MALTTRIMRWSRILLVCLFLAVGGTAVHAQYATQGNWEPETEHLGSVHHISIEPALRDLGLDHIVSNKNWAAVSRTTRNELGLSIGDEILVSAEGDWRDRVRSYTIMAVTNEHSFNVRLVRSGRQRVGFTEPFAGWVSSGARGGVTRSGEVPGTPLRRYNDERVIQYIAEVEAWIHRLTNELRSDYGLHPYERDWELDQIARDHSIDQIERNFRELMGDSYVNPHVNPDGLTSGDRIRSGLGPRDDITGTSENLAWERAPSGRMDLSLEPEELARRFVIGWYESPGHRAALLHKNRDNMGVGVAVNNENNLFYGTQKFMGLRWKRPGN